MSARNRISRNDPCPCGSGRKYKKCCIGKHQFSGVASGKSTSQAKPAEHLYTNSMQLRDSGQIEAAKKQYETILQFWPDEARAVSGLGYCLVRLGQRERGMAEARRAVELDPGNLTCINELALLLFNSGELEESLKWAKRAVKMGPQGANANVIIANCYEKLHRIGDGLKANKLAQIANPGNMWLKFQEAKLTARNGDYERAKTILMQTTRVPGMDPELRRHLFGELGRVLDRLGNFDKAYEAFVHSGLEASHTPRAQRFNLQLRPALINAYIKGVTEERLRKFSPEDMKDDSWVPAFLVGFPRSGTTMTEQILAAHSGVLTLSEQPYLDQVRLEWGRIAGANPDLGQMVDQLNPEIVLQLRKIYRTKVEADQEIANGAKVVIDKLPLNIIDIGFINLIFPEAKIIVALRDPRDCTLSCFMQDFELNSAMIHFLALDRATRFYTQVMGLWLHLRDMISLPYTVVRYEDTVQNLEFEAKRLIEFLGLNWEADILHFHQRAAGRAISTPSYAAVTEPVHTRAIGRWKNYREPFIPLLPMLEPYIREFGYEVE